jgi:hypothetical protein
VSRLRIGVKPSLEKGKHRIKNGVLGEIFAVVSGQQGEDWGKGNGLVPKTSKVKICSGSLHKLSFLRASPL